MSGLYQNMHEKGGTQAHTHTLEMKSTHEHYLHGRTHNHTHTHTIAHVDVEKTHNHGGICTNKDVQTHWHTYKQGDMHTGHTDTNTYVKHR